MAAASSGLPKILTMPSKLPGTPALPTVLPASSTASGIATGTDKNEIYKNRRTLNFTVVKLKSFISKLFQKKKKTTNKVLARKIIDLVPFL